MTTSLEPFFVDDFVLVFLDFLEPLLVVTLVGALDGASLALLPLPPSLAIKTAPSTEESAMTRRVARIRNKFFMLSIVLLRIRCEI